MPSAKRVLTRILEASDIRVDGDRPWDIQVHDERLYKRVLAHKNLGLGEAYMEGWWDCRAVDAMVAKLLVARAQAKVRGGLGLAWAALKARLGNPQSRRRARKVAEVHYNLDDAVYEAMLDPHRQYSCAYFKDTGDLVEAQTEKMRLICDKLGLEPGMRLLDIGCGWGGLAAFAAREYGARVTGVNISTEQIAHARERCRGLDVDILEMDYRGLGQGQDTTHNTVGAFHRVVSVGMFEHVGPKNHRALMEAAARCLTPDGRFLLHTIGCDETTCRCDPWIDRYIFPGGVVPSLRHVARAAEGLFVMEDWHNLCRHYDATLLCWLGNFRRAWPGLRARHGERFRRMWEYYLQISAAAFRARDNQLWQIVFSPPGAAQPDCRLA